MYGLNFSSKDDADVFANAMIRALEVMNDCQYDCHDDCHDDVSDEVIINLVEGQLELAGLVRRRKPDKDTLRSGISGR